MTPEELAKLKATEARSAADQSFKTGTDSQKLLDRLWARGATYGGYDAATNTHTIVGSRGQEKQISGDRLLTDAGLKVGDPINTIGQSIDSMPRPKKKPRPDFVAGEEPIDWIACLLQWDDPQTPADQSLSGITLQTLKIWVTGSQISEPFLLHEFEIGLDWQFGRGQEPYDQFLSKLWWVEPTWYLQLTEEKTLKVNLVYEERFVYHNEEGINTDLRRYISTYEIESDLTGESIEVRTGRYRGNDEEEPTIVDALPTAAPWRALIRDFFIDAAGSSSEADPCVVLYSNLASPSVFGTVLERFQCNVNMLELDRSIVQIHPFEAELYDGLVWRNPGNEPLEEANAIVPSDWIAGDIKIQIDVWDLSPASEPTCRLVEGDPSDKQLIEVLPQLVDPGLQALIEEGKIYYAWVTPYNF